MKGSGTRTAGCENSTFTVIGSIYAGKVQDSTGSSAAGIVWTSLTPPLPATDDYFHGEIISDLPGSPSGSWCLLFPVWHVSFQP